MSWFRKQKKKTQKGSFILKARFVFRRRVASYSLALNKLVMNAIMKLSVGLSCFRNNCEWDDKEKMSERERLE